jgi:hypothetical protein
VRAVTDCVAPNDVGEWSAPFTLGCFFGGTIAFLSPRDGDDITSGTVPIGVNVTGTGTYTQAMFAITQASTSYSQTIGPVPYSAGTPNFLASWDATGRSGVHQITVVVTEASGCIEVLTITVDVVTPVACCLSVKGDPLITQVGNDRFHEFTLENVCGVDLTVDQVTIQMTDSVGDATKLKAAEFDLNGLFFDPGGSGDDVTSAPLVIPVSGTGVLSSGLHTLTTTYSKDITDCSGTINPIALSIRYTRPETGSTQYTCTFSLTTAAVSCL